MQNAIGPAIDPLSVVRFSASASTFKSSSPISVSTPTTIHGQRALKVSYGASGT